jgi:MoxR-like ATPase
MNDLKLKIQKSAELLQQVEKALHQVVVGQENMITKLLVGLLTNGHVLIEGVPGLAKTLTISTLAKLLDVTFKRIQFTPDLLPADLIGTLIYNQKESKFEVKKGPIFANIILADEINRSPAKVQSALLEAMQEKQVTIGDTTFPLDKPFLVLATQNPIDQEGTYPLPEAQIDRFMMKIHVDYPTKEEEKIIMKRMSKTEISYEMKPILRKQDILEIRNYINQIQINERLENYIVNLIIATRKPEEYGLNKLKTFIEFGASPRATIALNLASKALAFLNGRDYVLPEDIKNIAMDVLNHRIILTYEADAANIHSQDCIQEILNTVKI